MSGYYTTDSSGKVVYEKPWGDHTDTQIAREILNNALTLALSTNHPRIDTELMELENDYSEAKQKRVRKILAKMIHKIFFKHIHVKDQDFSGSDLVRIFDEYNLEG